MRAKTKKNFVFSTVFQSNVVPHAACAPLHKIKSTRHLSASSHKRGRLSPFHAMPTTPRVTDVQRKSPSGHCRGGGGRELLRQQAATECDKRVKSPVSNDKDYRLTPNSSQPLPRQHDHDPRVPLCLHDLRYTTFRRERPLTPPPRAPPAAASATTASLAARPGGAGPSRRSRAPEGAPAAGLVEAACRTPRRRP